MWVSIAVIYAIGVIATFVYDGMSIKGPIRYSRVSLGALIWPIFLPLLINANREQ